jgi:fluoride exporter
VRRVAAVAAGGAVGATLRYAFLVLFPVEAGVFPLTILAENLVGAFALGVLGSVLVARWPEAADLHAFAMTGVVGSFTTFSAVSLDLVLLVEAGRGLLAAAYASASVCLGLLVAVAGTALGRRLA